MTGLNIEESSGSSQIGSALSESPEQQILLGDIQFLSHSQSGEHFNPIVLKEATLEQSQNLTLNLSQISSQSEDQQVISLDASNNNSPDNVQEFEVISVPFETSASKTDLQMELLRQQIEYTKRDIYHRELKIFEKERSLSITTEERIRLLDNSKSIFNKRKTI